MNFVGKAVLFLGIALIVAGITFARRPVSEVLPPQTRPIQPGGVTLTTHPVTTTPTSPAVRPSRTTSPAQRQAPVEPRNQAHRVDEREQHFGRKG